MSNKLFYPATAALLLARLMIDLWGIDYYTEKTHGLSHFSWQKDYEQSMNIDEYELSRSAKYFLLGYGFVTDVNFDKPDYRKGLITKSALRPKYQVLADAAAIKIYMALNPSFELKPEGNMPGDYYDGFSFALMLLKNIFLIISIPFFYRLAQLYLGGIFPKLATLLYVCYPSIFFFIGYYNLYDCVLMPVFVMVISMIATAYKRGNAFTWKETLLCGLLLSLSLIKSQSFLLIGAIYFSLFIASMKQLNSRLIRFAAVSVLMVALSAAPLFYLNYRDYKAFFITTQSGSVMMQGHSEWARGSWDPRYWDKHKTELDSMLAPYMHLMGDEQSESKVFSMLAWKWIKENPVKELKLIVKKTILLFYPHNFINWKINLVTLLFHLCFTGAALMHLAWWRSTDKSLLIIYGFVASVWLVNVIFIVEYRWRLFIDPFIVLTGFIFLEKVFHYFGKKKETKDITAHVPLS